MRHYRVIESRFLPFRGFSAIALWPFIVIRREFAARNADNELREITERHEAIHLKQQEDLLILGFFVCYLFAFLYTSFKTLSFRSGYRCNVFEREAYKHQDDAEYLSRRRAFEFLRGS